METELVWLRGELRLADNPLLDIAPSVSERLVVFVIDEALLDGTSADGVAGIGARRLRFLWQCLKELRGTLLKKGSDLLVAVDEPVSLVARLAEQYQVTRVVASEAAGGDDQLERLARCLPRQCRLERRGAGTLWTSQTLPMTLDEVPASWSAFRRRLGEASPRSHSRPAPATQPAWPERAPRGLPSLQRLSREADALNDVPDSAGLAFVGGEAPAWQRLDDVVWESDLLATYQQTRNGLIGAGFSSRLSPWLALGCVSATQVLEALREWEDRRGANASSRHFYHELLWREYFHWAARQEGKALFGDPPSSPGPAFECWRLGATGQPLIDAAMRELTVSGWLSNRARQLVASYLVHDLGEDWRHGAAWFERCLIDHDVASNWGNWKYIAGVGRNAKPRIFDIDEQSRRYDPDERYVRHWKEVSLQPSSYEALGH
ncbi:DASH family cryptochrome [Halomonas litopenaei]|nr:DASH family cryptochrome [Halomonas litopenaei]